MKQDNDHFSVGNLFFSFLLFAHSFLFFFPFPFLLGKCMLYKADFQKGLNLI